MFLVKSEQYLSDSVAGLFSVSSPSEAVAETPDLIVKSRIMPLQASDHPIP
jgi:hypothetical protein